MSSALDPPYTLDSGGMLGRIESQPQQIEDALARGAAERWGAPASAVGLLAVGAMGGSAMAAELAAGLDADRLPQPVIVVRDYQWPACVSHGALALLCSYSGETEETLTLYREAGTRGVARAAIAAGGRLAEWCARDQVPLARVPGGAPPRAALFPCWVALSGLLRGLGWIGDPTAEWREAATVLRAGVARCGAATLESANPVKRMARALQGRTLFIYAGGQRLGAAATRVRNQLNENAKLLGHSALAPELNHNEIVGWERAEPASAGAAVLVLRDREDAPEVARRLALTAEFVAARGAAVHEWPSAGESRLARLASLVQFADYLSFYLALLNGVDPTPIASIDEFKRRLSAR
jgi:glucose/mannose-6-phosphate isomerase